MDHLRRCVDLARWAAENVAAELRPACTVYTSGEHCPLCSAAHAWVGLGRIVYAGSTAQLTEWRRGWGLPAGPVTTLPINAIAPNVPVRPRTCSRSRFGDEEAGRGGVGLQLATDAGQVDAQVVGLALGTGAPDGRLLDLRAPGRDGCGISRTGSRAV